MGAGRRGATQDRQEGAALLDTGALPAWPEAVAAQASKTPGAGAPADDDVRPLEVGGEEVAVPVGGEAQTMGGATARAFTAPPPGSVPTDGRQAHAVVARTVGPVLHAPVAAPPVGGPVLHVGRPALAPRRPASGRSPHIRAEDVDVPVSGVVDGPFVRPRGAHATRVATTLPAAHGDAPVRQAGPATGPLVASPAPVPMTTVPL